MNTLWLKIMAIAVAALIGIIVVANFTGGDKTTAPQPTQAGPEDRTVYDTWKDDDKRLNAPIPSPNQPQPAATQSVVAPVQPQAQVPPQRPPKFKPLEEEQQVRAEQLWQMVLTQRKMGRLPVMTYGQMVQYCRQIIREFPGTEYAYRAKRALADIPESARQQHNITQKELDLSEFTK